MIDPSDAATVGKQIEDLTRRAEASTAPEFYGLDEDTALIARVLRNDEKMATVHLERFLPAPQRQRGHAIVLDPGDFISYVQRLGNGRTTVWGDESARKFTAVFNDHGPDGAGWRDHTAALQLANDPDWEAFAERDGRMFNQVTFAEFLQDYRLVIVQPDAATLLEVASSFKAHKKAEFSSAVDLMSGDLKLTYNEETNAKSGTTKSGELEIPQEFVVRLPPFLGLPPVEVTARLRYSINEGTLSLGFRLVRPDLVQREAFADLSETIFNGVKDNDVSVYLGVPPSNVHPND